ncbi:MAG: SurA N-terminal domain-containing protein [Pseudomonadota bacterium]
MIKSRSTAPIHGMARIFPLMLSGLCCLFAMSATVSAESQIVDRIVAVVNDEIIVFQDLNKMLDPVMENMRKSGQPPEKVKEFLYEKRKQLLEMLIGQKLILQESKLFTITVEEKEVDGAIERMKASNQLTDETLREALKNQGTTMQEFRASFREQILLNRMEQIEVRSKIVVTKEDVKAYYDAHPDQYQGNSQYRLRHLMIAAPTPEREAARQKIEAARAALTAGTPFTEVVKQYADRQFADRDGELGLFLLNDLSPRLKGMVEKLAAGQSTPILETDQGYQIIHLEEIVQTGTTPLEKVADDIEEALMKEAFRKKKQDWLEGLRKRAHIKIIS